MVTVTNLWGADTQAPLSILSTTSSTVAPAVADSGGTELAVAFTLNGRIDVNFYDEQGLPSTARTPISIQPVTSGAAITDVAVTSSGAAFGYGIAWSESGTLYGQYVSKLGLFGQPVQIGTGTGLQITGYQVLDAAGAVISDGFEAVWVDNGKIMFGQFGANIAKDVPAPGSVLAAAPAAIEIGSGSEPSISATVNGDTAIVWVDQNGHDLHMRLVAADGTVGTDSVIATGSDAITHLDTVQVGASIAIAWSTASVVTTDIYTVAGTIAVPGSATSRAFFSAASVADLSLGQMLDLPAGFTLAFIDGTGSKAISYGPGGNPLDFTTLQGTGEFTPAARLLNTTAAHLDAASLVGDRVFVASQAADGSVIGNIVDPRALGQALVGIADTIDARGRVTTINDVLVGTIGNDTITGLGGADTLDGAMGNDRFVAGTALAGITNDGNDSIDGGAGVDTYVLTGTQADYTITHLGGALYQIVDKGTNAGTRVVTGIDFVNAVEKVQFAGGGAVDLATLVTPAAQVNPTGWGLTNEDDDVTPNLNRLPDVDGMLISNGADQKGTQVHPVISDSIGEFVAILWENHQADGSSHIRGAFTDVLGQPDGITPLPDIVSVTDGKGYETNALVASGGANSGWGLAFSETLDGTSTGIANIKSNFFSLNLTGTETFVDKNVNANQHDGAIFGSFLDRKVQLDQFGQPVVSGGHVVIDGPDAILPAGMNDGYNVIYVETPVGSADGVYGAIRFQRYEVALDALGQAGPARAAGIDGLAGVDINGNTGAGVDAAVTLAASGRNPSITALHTFETVATWIEKDAGGKEQVVVTALDDMGNKFLDRSVVSPLATNETIAAGTNAIVAQAAAVNAAIVWVVDVADAITGLHDHFELRATMLSSPGLGLNGQGFGFVNPSVPFTVMTLPETANRASLHISGISGENSPDIIVQFEQDDLHGLTPSTGVFAQHVLVTLDPISGVALAMTPNGATVQVNADAIGTQDQSGVAGLLGDRFISVWHDTSLDGNGDIVARVMDTRDPTNPQPIIGDFVSPRGVIVPRRDILVGTIGNDSMQGDILDFDGRVDEIHGGLGNDTMMGGPGLKGVAGLPEIIDGGEGTDYSVYTGRLSDYTISPIFDAGLGFGFEIKDNRPTQDAAGDPLQHDGNDNVYNVEFLQFAPDVAGGAPVIIDVRNLLKVAAPDPLASYNGTPVTWSLTDTSTYKERSIDASAGTQHDVAVTNRQDGTAFAWINGTNQVFGLGHDLTGNPDPLFLPTKTQLNTLGNAVADVDLGMTGLLGFTAVWESNVGGTDTEIHFRTASTNTLVAGAGALGANLLGLGETSVVGSSGTGTEVAVDPVIQGYEMVDSANNTLELGFHVGFALKANAAATYGTLELARYEIPVYDVNAGATALATDANGNLIRSLPAAFGLGAETAPTSLGLDGIHGTADDNSAIVLTEQGLRAANNLGGATAIQGRDMSLAGLHGGELVVSYIGADEQVHVRLYAPTVLQNLDREAVAGNGGVDLVAQGLTTYSEVALPTSALGGVAVGQTQYVVPQLNGSFAVFWAAAGAVAGTVDIKAVIFTGLGSWSASNVVTVESGLAAGVKFQVASTGVAPTGAEDGYFVSWEVGGNIVGQRMNMLGDLVGDQVNPIDDPAATNAANHTLHSSTGIDDGRMLIAYQDAAGDVSAQYLDTRQPGITHIGPRAGALNSAMVGTVGDDAMDGRNRADQMWGGLGDDIITLGADSDFGDGGAGNDTIFGGPGQDEIVGGAGNDLLHGGGSGPAAAGALAPINAALTAALSAAVAATNPGADIISGDWDSVAGVAGAGIDTISYRGEFGTLIGAQTLGYRVDLAAGLTYKAVAAAPGTLTFTDAGAPAGANTRSYILEDAIGRINAAGNFVFTHDIENAEGSRAADVLIGDAGNNVMIGGGGNDFIDADGGTGDTAVFELTASHYSVTRTATGLSVTREITPATATSAAVIETVTLRNVEFLQFADQRVAASNPAITTTAVAANTLPNANNAPTAFADSLTIAEDHIGVIKPLANDIEPDGGQTLTITAVNGQAVVAGGAAVTVANGTVALGNNSQLIFTPTANYNGPAIFTYDITDGNGGTSQGTVNITISAVPDAAIGVADDFTVSKNHVLGNSVLTNDVNLDNLLNPHAGLSVASVTSDVVGAVASTTPGTVALTHGSLVWSADGNFTYTPENGTSGTETFTYVATSGNGLFSQPTTVTINVIDVPNVAPSILGDLTSDVLEGGTVDLTTADITFSDPDAPVPPTPAFLATETFLVSNLTNGSLLVGGKVANSFTAADIATAGRVQFRHDGSETTTAGFTVIVNDGIDTSAARNFTVNVTPVNDAAVIGGTATTSFTEDGAGVAVAPTLSIADPDSGFLSSATVTITNYAAVNAGQTQTDVLSFVAPIGSNIIGSYLNGVLTLSGTDTVDHYLAALRSVTFSTASQRPSQTSRSVTFQVTDVDANGTNNLASNIATATVNVIGVNDAPTGGVSITSVVENAAPVNTFTVTPTNTLADVDLVGAPTVSYQLQASATLNGTYGIAGTGTLTNVPAPAAATYYRVAANYTDPFGTTQVVATDRILVGSTGANTLSATGVNYLLGMAGVDTINLDAGTLANVVIDGGAGADVLQLTSVANFAPTDAQLRNVERVTTTLGTPVTINMSLQSEAITMVGGLGNDTLMGGAGADSMDGGRGSDRYLNVQATDTVVDNGNAGDIDTIVLTNANATALNAATGTIATNNARLAGIETIDATAVTSALTVNLTAQSEAYTVLGGTANDTLTGGTANDTIVGGAGNDLVTGGTGTDVAQFAGAVTRYSLDLDASNRVVVTDQLANGDGVDTLATIETLRFNGVNYTLFAGTTSTTTGDRFAGANNSTYVMVGGAGNDSLAGANGNDVIFGGTGNDTIVSGNGSDTIVFNTAFVVVNTDTNAGNNNIDSISYVVVDDVIALDDAVFTGLSVTSGALNAASWQSGAGLTSANGGTADARIVFNTTTRGLFYDADGRGAGAGVQFATLTTLTGTMTQAEFVIF